MLAAYYERTGPAADVLTVGELPTPTPGLNEVRVKVHWSGVNPSDVKSRAGLRSKTLAFSRIVPHSDGAGVIDQVGEGVDSARVGERVWLWNGAWGRPFGTAAEYIVLPSAQAVRLPDGVDPAAAACFGIPALTAYQAVAIDGGVTGMNVLVAGGAGAVGHYAIQFAKALGAKQVVATVSGEAKAALAQDAGADVVINYKSDDVAKKCLDVTGGAGMDRIIEVDIAANAALDLSVLRAESDIVIYGSGAQEAAIPFYPALVKSARLRFFIVYNLNADDRARGIAGLTRLLEAGTLKHNVAARVPLARIAEAHELVERGQLAGNVVVSVGEAAG